MVSLTAVTATTSENSPWRATAYAALFTAIIALATALLFQRAIPILYLPAFLLIGAAPVLGYDMAQGRLGRDWKPLVGGLLGFVLLVFGFILWPILVGAFSKQQSIGKLLLASIVGFVLGIIVFLILGTMVGQNPSWITSGWVLLWAVWGGTCGAAMVAYGKPEEEP
jgi:phosphoglycerol transferase MdoB-like AlkP superfamily enzyme